MAASSESFVSVTPYRIIYGDTDQMGVAYYANYLRWFEVGRTEMLRQIGLPYACIEERGLRFPVIEVTCRYYKPARYDETILIETRLSSLGRAILTFGYRLSRESDGVLLADGATKHASVEAGGRVVRISRELHAALARAVAPPPGPR